jgi:alkanesulfonate monooxygenase SsuD/methylene tetrahydromethanopterin reductase-like flavin-dependent oxidoreductase (luciferase family)
LARDTTRLRIGTLVTSITYRHPTLLAAHAIAPDHLSHGRLQLGIGAGGRPLKERSDRLAEQVAILDRLLGGESVTYAGRYYRYRAIGIDEITFYWPPLDNVVEQRPITAEQQARFERIATERLARLEAGLKSAN